ncbi:hypothetical protein PUN28_017365 [Cardiocondyla obscurior]|uniref:Uncharacterized protein n=1 Tax=Cardiocondyla obscurior TaxID=286306 RepID=A0AAW2EQ65_9HYME
MKNLVRIRANANELSRTQISICDAQAPPLSLILSLSLFLSAMLIISSLYAPLFRFCCSVTLGFSRYITLINVKKVYDNCHCKKKEKRDKIKYNVRSHRRAKFYRSCVKLHFYFRRDIHNTLAYILYLFE